VIDGIKRREVDSWHPLVELSFFFFLLNTFDPCGLMIIFFFFFFFACASFSITNSTSIIGLKTKMILPSKNVTGVHIIGLKKLTCVLMLN
jgi:hypothetical protein